MARKKPKKYFIVNSNLEIKSNEKLIMNKVKDLI